MEICGNKERDGNTVKNDSHPGAVHGADGAPVVERRKQPRYPVRVRAAYEVGQNILEGEIHNLNTEGAYLKSEVILPALATLKRLRFRLPNNIDVEVSEALVVWNNDGTKNNFYPRGMGLFFLSIDPVQANRIKEYVSREPKS